MGYPEGMSEGSHEVEGDTKKIKGKEVDLTDIKDGSIPVYREAQDKFIMEDKPTGGSGGIHGNELHDPDMATTTELSTHEANADAHHIKFTTIEHDTTLQHTLGTVVPHDALASLTEKSHANLTDVTESQHHTKFTITEHDTTVRHSLGTVVPHDALASLTEKSHTSLTDKGTNTHIEIDSHLGAVAPHSGHEQTANKGAISGYTPLDVNQKVPTVNLGGVGADNTKFLRGDQTWQVPAGGSTPPSYMQEALIECYPFGGTPTTLTATNHTATAARIFPFEVDRPITINTIRIRTNAVLANCLICGIYDSAGTRLWQSGVLSTIATSWLDITANLPITLPIGTYYFATTNNNIASTTAAYSVTPAVGGAFLPRWGTVPTTNGAIPASIDPTAITETTGGWMCYVLLSNVTT